MMARQTYFFRNESKAKQMDFAPCGQITISSASITKQEPPQRFLHIPPKRPVPAQIPRDPGPHHRTTTEQRHSRISRFHRQKQL